MDKYKLTEEAVNNYNRILYRIQALKDFGDIKKGDKGGWVEGKSNLNQDGEAWVYGDAQVYGDARVFGDAQVYGNARVYGDAWVFGNTKVYGDARVYGDDIIKQISNDEPEKESILDEAKRITDGDRNAEYGLPEDNFQRIADYWNMYIGHKVAQNQGPYCEPKDIAMMMVLMKIAREDFKHKRDNLVDAAGYLRCASKIKGDEQ